MSCQLPCAVGFLEDQLPRHLYRTGCQYSCPCPGDKVNNPCRNAKVPSAKAGTEIVCDYGAKQYYHQPLHAKAQIMAARDQAQKQSWYN